MQCRCTNLVIFLEIERIKVNKELCSVQKVQYLGSYVSVDRFDSEYSVYVASHAL